MIVSQVYNYVKTYQIVHFNMCSFCISYFSRNLVAPFLVEFIILAKVLIIEWSPVLDPKAPA